MAQSEGYFLRNYLKEVNVFGEAYSFSNSGGACFFYISLLEIFILV